MSGGRDFVHRDGWTSKAEDVLQVFPRERCQNQGHPPVVCRRSCELLRRVAQGSRNIAGNRRLCALRQGFKTSVRIGIQLPTRPMESGPNTCA